MSFILDALKKSESERQRQLAPGVIDPGFAVRRAGLPPWAVVLLVLLFVNVIVLSFVLLRRGTPPPAAPRSASQQAAAPGAGPAPAAFSPMDNTPQYAPEIPLVETPIGPPGIGADSGSSAARSPQGRAVARGISAAPTAAAEQAAAAQDEPLPTIGEVDFSGTGTPPELHLDVHVYAANPAERFVFINGRKYVEGSFVQDGLRVERIRRDGVAMNYRGKRFLLPRQ